MRARVYFSAGAEKKRKQEEDQLSAACDAAWNEYTRAPFTERLSSGDAKQLSSDEYCSNAIEFLADIPRAYSN